MTILNDSPRHFAVQIVFQPVAGEDDRSEATVEMRPDEFQRLTDDWCSGQARGCYRVWGDAGDANTFGTLLLRFDLVRYIWHIATCTDADHDPLPDLAFAL